ncbi:hypothetical protein A2774_03020 [Candidatus Roizmanbacteria bacterium RIFCSPHIGHO2_01_FULL_39_12c]|uniref:Uncharacterized protein n=1 Tax=Candidatus Roizmanbacteria bacterium RIFCSPHIGHO2_01_FULL_39_12c TaxID=1802031 RepID=A0A1F7GCV5_9BACT|nr:MAG: hypothetical protein A2774_03020 [Candidatus Roizmanbacteria bacterium RIFCSPHIGHO2_01_FULL_39_12c]OGK47429.1 MAG: hypothetical protein A2963_04720 [Candidatus Roizmanbacteria bacterium RIFCSPLOWO2_01_FULL_40_13]
MKNIIAFIILFFFLLFSFNVVEAKLLPRFRSGGAKRVGFSGGIGSNVRLRGDRQAIIVNFNNLSKASNVMYTLIYQTNGKDEGVSGSLDSSTGNSVARELLFGTCSHGVCRYHANITNMRLEILTTYKSGKRTLRRYKIRV